MKYEDMRDQICTGDLFLEDGDGVVSDIIEAATDGQFSHVAVFFWMGDGLWVAQTYEGEGFSTKPASQYLKTVAGKGYLGIAPPIVRQNPEAVINEISRYRCTPDLQPYGYSTLPLVWVAHVFHAEISPDKVQAVCSIFAEQCWQAAGIKFDTLADPSDFDSLVAGVVEIDLENI